MLYCFCPSDTGTKMLTTAIKVRAGHYSIVHQQIFLSPVLPKHPPYKVNEYT
jgi:hypothetical protein